jgi:hypothetical protein
MGVVAVVCVDSVEEENNISGPKDELMIVSIMTIQNSE